MSTVRELVVKFGLNTQGFEGGAVRAERSAASLTRSLERQASTWGMPAREAKIAGLAMRGASEESLAAALAADKQISALEELAETQRKAARVVESVRTPTENYNREMADLDKMLVRGAIDQETYNRAAAAAKMKLDGAGAAASAATGPFARLRAVMSQKVGIMSSFTSVAGGVIRQLFTLQGAILGAAGAGGMLLLTKNSMDYIDRTAKVSDRLGIATERLIGIRHAAELAGVGSENLDKSLSLMNRAIGEVTSGIGTEAVAAFDRLGLSADQLAAMSPADAFGEIAESIKGVESASERAAIAQKIFGRGGQELINTLMTGKDGLAAAQAEAEKLGMTFNRVDAAKVEAANDAITKMKGVLTGVFQTMAIQIAPFITTMADRFTAAAASGEGMGSRVTGAFEGIVKGVAAVADYLKLAEAAWHAFKFVGLGAISVITRGLTEMANLAVDALNIIPGVKIEKPQFLNQFADELERQTTEAMMASGKAFDSFMSGEASQTAAAAFEKIRKDQQAAAEAMAASSAANAVPDLADSVAEQAANMADAIDPAQKILDSLRERLDGIGKTDLQKTIDQLRQIGTPQQVKDAELFAAKIREIEEAQQERADLEQFAKGVIADQITPLEKFASLESKLNDALAAKLLTQEQYNEALRRGREEIEKTNLAAGEGRQLSRFDFRPRMDAASAMARRGRGDSMAGGAPTLGADGKPLEVKGQDKVVSTLVGIRGDMRSVLAYMDVS